MGKRRKKNADEKFLKYFRNTFFIDRSTLINSYDENDIDTEYNFEPEKSGDIKNIFKTINNSFNKEKYQEIEALFRKKDILSKNKNIEDRNLKEDKENLSNFEKSEKSDKQNKNSEIDSLQKLYDKKEDVSEINLKNITDIINNTDPYELYDVLNEDTDTLNRVNLAKNMEYINLAHNYEKKCQEIKNNEILGIQNFYSSGSAIFNKIFFEEFVSDIFKYGIGKRLNKYFSPLVNLPKKMLFGEGSLENTMDTVLKVHKDERMSEIIKDDKDFKSEYENVKKVMKQEFYHTNLDEINEINKVRKNFRIGTLDNYIETLSFNSNHYLKEYKKLEPFLKRYNIKKMTKRNLKNLYEDRDRLFKDLEKKLGEKLSDTTKNLVLNEVIINSYMEKKLAGKTYIVIDEIKSPFFGLKVPFIKGKVDIDLIYSGFDILSRQSRNEIVKTAKKFADRKTRIVNQLIKNYRNVFNFNDKQGEIRDLLLDDMKLELDEKTVDKITDFEKLENMINQSSASFVLNNINYEFKSRFDVAIIKTVLPFIEKNPANKEKIISYLNKNSVIAGSKQIYNYDFEEFYRNISSNPKFKIDKADLQRLDRNKNQIGKMLKQGIPVTKIVDKYKFIDIGNMIFVLNVFKENLNARLDNGIFKNNLNGRNKPNGRYNEESLDFSFRDSFFEEKPDLEILNGQSSYIQSKAAEFSKIIEENQEKINAFNLKNNEIFTENFDNTVHDKNNINLVNELKKTGFEIENLKFLSQNLENIRKSNFLKMGVLSMQNKLTSTQAVEILLKSSILEKQYRDLLKVTDRFYVEILKDAIKKKWQVLLKDYYTDTELLKNDIIINPKLNARLIREIEYNLGLYNSANLKEKVKMLSQIMSNLDIKQLNKDFIIEERRKAGNFAKNLFNNDSVRLTDNNIKMHELLNGDIEKFKRMDENTKKAVNKFADRFMERLRSNKSEDKGFSEKFDLNTFNDREFIDYVVKYESVDNTYIRELLALDDEGTFAETGYQNQSFQEFRMSNKLAGYRGQMKMSALRKVNLIGRKVFVNHEIKKYKNNLRKLKEEIEDVKLKMKEIMGEFEKEYEEDMLKISRDRKESLENQEKTKEKFKEDIKITVMQAVENKKEEEKNEAQREYEEDMEKLKEEKENIEEYVRVRDDFMR